MKKLLPLLIIILFPFLGYTQALHNNGAVLHLNAGSVVSVNGNFQNQVGSTFTNNGNLQVMGNVTNNQLMPFPGSGTLEFVGTTGQIVGGSAAYRANNVLVNNANGLTLNTPLEVTGTVTFTNGIVTSTTASNSLKFTTSGTHSGASDASHVNGYTVKEGTGNFTYPVGDGAKYEPIDINLSTNLAGMTVRYDATNGGTGPFTATGSDPSPLMSVNHLEHWDIAPITAAIGTVTLYWNAYQSIVLNNTSDVRVGHYVAGGWQNEGSNSITGTTSSGSVTSNTITIWSPFSLGSMTVNVPLPLSELNFTGIKEVSSNRLLWTTNQEKNNGYFLVQRSNNAKDFETIGKVFSKAINGNSTTNINYKFTHTLNSQELQEGGNIYYRLQLVDIDEKLGKQSETIMLTRETNKNIVKIYPNPTKDAITIITSLKHQGALTIKCLNMQGQIVKEIQSTQNETQLQMNDLPMGIYMVQVLQKNEIISTHKIEKN